MRRLARALLYGGTVGIVAALGRFHAQFVGHYYFHSMQRLPWTLAFALFLCVAAYAVGLPDLDRRRSAWGPAISASVLAALAISVVQVTLGSLLLPRFVVFSSVLLAIPWFAICVGIADMGRSREEDRDRVVLVAGLDEQAALDADVGFDLERPVSVVASLCVEDARATEARTKPLIEAVVSTKATLLVLDREGTADESVVAQAATLHESGLRVRSLSSFYDDWLGKLPLSELERMSVMFDVGELHRVRYGHAKRLCDVVVGVVGLAIMIVVLPVVLVGNTLANHGPLFYRQPRVGRWSRTFAILKFRTMSPNGSASEWTTLDDPRVTPFGRWLRRSHLDELPQVINILRGDQSVVGPRPEQPRYVAELREKIPYYDLRHLVRPGLTGWAQVKYPYGASESDALEKLQYDFYYLRHQGFGLDVRIIGRTLRSVMGRVGR